MEAINFMMRALWSASSGMTAQQLNVDVIANNLSNVNTNGYKKSRVEFKDLIYETLRRPDVYQLGQGTPVALQVGHGVRPSATTKTFKQGSLAQTDNTFDVAIEGEGFFMIEKPDQEDPVYTRDGSFKISMEEGDTERYLVTSEGYFVLDMDGEPIIIDEEFTDISISADGTMTGKADDEIEEIAQLGLAKFLNPQGLLSIGNNLYEETAASGEAIPKEDETDPGYGSILQGYLELSNVQVVEEMVNLITAQRAYEINTKAIQTSDEMLAQANNLRR